MAAASNKEHAIRRPKSFKTAMSLNLPVGTTRDKYRDEGEYQRYHKPKVERIVVKDSKNERKEPKKENK